MLLSKPLCYTGECACGNGGAAPPRRASGRSSHRAAVSLRQAQIHSATSHCACAQSSIEVLTTREAAHRSEVTEVEVLLLEVRQERGVTEREQATFLDLLAARKILQEERAHRS